MEYNKSKRTDIYSIDPRTIQVVDGFNSRVDFGNIEELAEQIHSTNNQVLNPISVQLIKNADGTEAYRLVDGERRYRAVMSLIERGEDIPYIKAILLPNNLSKDELYLQQALRNEGKNFNEYEWGLLAKKLINECGMNTAEVAKRLGKNTGVVTYWLQIFDYPQDIQEVIKNNELGGSDMRRLFRGHSHDVESVRNDIEHMRAKAQDKGRRKLTLKDLELTNAVKVWRDSKTILNGFNTLFNYIRGYAKEDGVDLKDMKFDLANIYNQLEQGKTIDVIFNRNQSTLRKAE